MHTAMHRPAAMGGERERERGCALSATHDRHHERPQHGAHAHARPGAPAAPLPGAVCGLSARRTASVPRRWCSATARASTVSEVSHASPGARAGGQGQVARALDASRRPRAGAHIPATALAANHDLALSLVLERDPVELGLVAAHLLNCHGASVVKLERHSNSGAGPRGRAPACLLGLGASGWAGRFLLVSCSPTDASAASAGVTPRI